MPIKELAARSALRQLDAPRTIMPTLPFRISAARWIMDAYCADALASRDAAKALAPTTEEGMHVVIGTRNAARAVAE